MRIAILIALFFVFVSDSANADDPAARPAASATDIEYFEKKIRPLLANRCFSCHSSKAKSVKGGLKLDSDGALFAGGDSGPAVVAGDPEMSLLIQSIRYDKDADFQMPPKGRLPAEEIAELTAWVKRGAPFPPDTNPAPQKDGGIDFAAAREFWSFRPAEEQALPQTKAANWPQQRLDHFVLAAMEQKGLVPSAEADRATLLRRLSFDLIGLPPTP